jgi:very-short-patch-repair endonuclease
VAVVGQAGHRIGAEIPVLAPDGYPRYYLDMGWEELKVAVEYDGEHHRKDDRTYRNDIIRSEYVASLDWMVVRVLKGHRQADILRRVDRAVIARGGFSPR